MLNLLFTIFFHFVHYQSARPEPKIEIIGLPSITNTETEFKVREMAYQEEFKNPDMLAKLIQCESKFRTNAINLRNRPGRGIDFGLLQINNKYHPEVPLSCSMDLTCSTKWAIWKIKSGHLKEWSCANYLKLKY